MSNRGCGSHWWKKIFAISVTSRDKDLIKTIIVDHILQGTIIYTDCWRAYDGAIKELNEDLHMYLQHFTVNHWETFKNDEGICTNGIVFQSYQVDKCLAQTLTKNFCLPFGGYRITRFFGILSSELLLKSYF